MVYKVIRFFTDLQDNNNPYNAGDIFPRNGLTVSSERLAELAGSNNKRGVPLIAPVEDAPKKTTKRTKKAADK